MARKKNIKDVEESKIVKKSSKSKKEEIKEEEELEEELQEEVEEETLDEEEVDLDNESEDDEYEDADEDEDEEDYDVVKKDKNGKKKKSAKKKEGFLELVGKELKKVVWPKIGEIIKYSIAVIIFCVILCLFFEGINLLAAFIKELFS